MKQFASILATATLALALAGCAAGPTRQAVVADRMPPMPPDVRALWDHDREYVCGFPTSPRNRAVPDGARQLLQQGRRGWVVARLSVAPDGTVRHSEVVASAPQGLFDQSALELLNTNTYPTRQDECSLVTAVWMGNPSQ